MYNLLFKALSTHASVSTGYMLVSIRSTRECP